MLVVINEDEGDHAVNTLQCPIGTTSMHGARARVGLQGSPLGPKVVKMFFSKLFLDHLGCSNKWFQAILSLSCPILAHASSPKPSTWAILGLTMCTKGGGGVLRLSAVDCVGHPCGDEY